MEEAYHWFRDPREGPQTTAAQPPPYLSTMSVWGIFDKGKQHHPLHTQRLTHPFILPESLIVIECQTQDQRRRFPRIQKTTINDFKLFLRGKCIEWKMKEDQTEAYLTRWKSWAMGEFAEMFDHIANRNILDDFRAEKCPEWDPIHSFSHLKDDPPMYYRAGSHHPYLFPINVEATLQRFFRWALIGLDSHGPHPNKDEGSTGREHWLPSFEAQNQPPWYDGEGPDYIEREQMPRPAPIPAPKAPPTTNPRDHFDFTQCTLTQCYEFTTTFFSLFALFKMANFGHQIGPERNTRGPLYAAATLVLHDPSSPAKETEYCNPFYKACQEGGEVMYRPRTHFLTSGA
uniref:Uncharacterized protein n=1 Tax=Chromera velia CCMP2878 TaxID=1169474 RepID=A0A0G4HU24_9ALVE|eukprot:Cvel_8588.t1-p1 / transcript=Cvel_8588.t1 / gene=Cvel_8588 / organism=Chromera_velia_CCMP2878 / gene_product=hypothetical protein / transcript_product=hypothetical protein / location=Cvel_scaffold476:76497-77525(-) / protein_length=343 / sequence_SO=supercontig / SO=protein_coding / is_pseudo=false